MERVKLSRQELEKRNARIVQLYQEGLTYQELRDMFHISGDTVKKLAVQAGVYVRKHENMRDKKRKPAPKQYQESVLTRERMDKETSAVRPEHIIAVRLNTRIGDHMTVMSEKGVLVGVNGSYIQDAVVISKKNPVFCLVRLVKSGLFESVAWSDIYVAQRDGQKVVGLNEST